MGSQRKIKAIIDPSKKLISSDPAAMQRKCSTSRALNVAMPLALVGALILVLSELDLSAVHPYFRFSSLMKENSFRWRLSRSEANRTIHTGRSNGGNQLEWVQFPVIPNETQLRLGQIEANGTHRCHGVRTHTGRVEGLPRRESDERPVRLTAGDIFHFLIVSVAKDGTSRCAGGDFYETDLSSEFWKSRPPVVDNGDGTYSVQMQVDPRFTGLYTLRISLLYANFHGVHLLVVDDLNQWMRSDEVLVLEIEFVEPPQAPLDQIRLDRCGGDDYDLKQWSGRWIRSEYNSSCEIDGAGRFMCLTPGTPCQEPWCQGPLDVLESNGWAYSAHCTFKLFSEDEAWQCLDGKWLFWWGDSNNLDTARNLLNFVLGLDVGPKMARGTDQDYVRLPKNPSDSGGTQQSVRMSNIFNGHSDILRNYQGLFALTNERFRERMMAYFRKDKSPDVMIMNSGLHDGCFWPSPMLYVQQGLQVATNFWKNVLDSILPKSPRFVYRTTIAVGGKSRARGFNPHKMELFNKFMVEKLQGAGLANMRIVDGYDLTFPWHYNNDHNDGAHYGKAPSNTTWVNGKIGHQYFVDLMLVHILLNAICDGS
ncbi:hypothetical protein Mapa_009545 [Marchantia paleacea]|nr:hypothetical protein Mapa_009545 [Marchantia paleacea]